MKYLLLCAVFAFPLWAQPGSYSYYNCFQSFPSLSGAYVDGYVFSGPFRANGPVRIMSASSGRDNDPFFYSFTLSSDYYIHGWGATQSTEPHIEELWIEPYEMMELGPPWFNLGVDPLPFGSDEVDWQSVRTTAMNSGLYLTSADVPDGSRILLEDGELRVLQTENGTEETYDLTALQDPVVWLENQTDHSVYVKGSPGTDGLSHELTMGMNGDIYLAGPLEYNDISPGLTGLISVYGDCFIAHDPISGDWTAPYDIVTDQDITVSASILLPEGCFKAENYSQPMPQVLFTLLGGIQMHQEGWTSTSTSGFDLLFDYDTRLFTESPPFYPQYELSGMEEESVNASPVSIEVVQNPFSGSLAVQVSSGVDIQVFDQSGRMADQSLSSSPPGIYFVRAVAPSGCTETIRVVKIQ